MTRIICRVSACAFWDHGICGAEEIEYELDDGCLTFQELVELELQGEEEEDLDWPAPTGGAGLDDDEDDWDDDWEDDEEDDDDPFDDL